MLGAISLYRPESAGTARTRATACRWEIRGETRTARPRPRRALLLPSRRYCGRGRAGEPAGAESRPGRGVGGRRGCLNGVRDCRPMLSLCISGLHCNSILFLEKNLVGASPRPPPRVRLSTSHKAVLNATGMRNG